MKTTTALEFLVFKTRQERINRWEQLIEIIMLQNEWATREMFTIGFMDETDLMIDVDEKYFIVDNINLKDWLSENTICNINSDKVFSVSSIR